MEGPLLPVGVAPALLVLVGILELVEDRFRGGAGFPSEERSRVSPMVTSR